MHMLHGADAAADSQRHKTFFSRALDDLDHGRAPVCGRGDIEKDHLIRALLIVAERQLYRVADIPQTTLLGPAKLNPSGDNTVVNIETGDNSFCQHNGNCVSISALIRLKVK